MEDTEARKAHMEKSIKETETQLEDKQDEDFFVIGGSKKREEKRL